MKARQKFRDAFFTEEQKNNGQVYYPMTLEKSIQRLVQMLVYVQLKQANYLTNRLPKDIQGKKDRWEITVSEFTSKMSFKDTKWRDQKRAVGKLAGNAYDEDPQREDDEKLKEVKRKRNRRNVRKRQKKK